MNSDKIGVAADSVVDDRRGRDISSVPVASIKPSDSPRLNGEDEGHVNVLMETGARLPPIVVHRATMRVIDGMHRLRVAQRRGSENVDVEYFDGDEHEAFVLCVRANIAHGLPLSLGDRKAAAARIMRSHPQWSDRRIASIAGLAPSTVGAIRRCSIERTGQSNTRVGRDGRERPLDPSKSRLSASDIMKENPSASIREIATAVGLAPSTVQNVRDRLRAGNDPIPARQAGRGRLMVTSSGIRPEIERLRSDPSLRFTDSGRALLRLFDASSAMIENSTQLATAVPPHAIGDIAQVALEIGNSWYSFAERIRTTSRKNVGP